MKRCTLLLCLVLCPGLAWAADGCEVSAAGADISIAPSLSNTGQIISDYGMVQISCAVGLPWSLEVANAQPGGKFGLLGSRGNTLPAALAIANTGSTFGSASNGEQMGGVGDGTSQSISIRTDISLPVIPPADTYQAVLYLGISF